MHCYLIIDISFHVLASSYAMPPSFHAHLRWVALRIHGNQSHLRRLMVPHFKGLLFPEK